MSLKIYRNKRDFLRTTEPKGSKVNQNKDQRKYQKKDRPPAGLRFVVHLHRASRLHYDFRLEIDGVLKSWAVPKGPSLNPLDQRLAVLVEDHPMEYGDFEGIIPKGNYGAGTVMIWDEGTYVERSHVKRVGASKRKQDLSQNPNRDLIRGLESGHLTFVLDGKKLQGEFALIRLEKYASGKSWLLVKKRDEHANFKINQGFEDISVKTGRAMDAIAHEAEKSGEVWQPRSKAKPKKNSVVQMPRRVRPLLPINSRGSVAHPDWIAQDYPGGRRCIAELEGGTVHLYTKSGLSFDKKFSEILLLLSKLKVQAILDGEITDSGDQEVYFVFDILFWRKDLRDLTLNSRLKELAKFFSEHSRVFTKKHLKEDLTKVQRCWNCPRHGHPTGFWLEIPRVLTPLEFQNPGRSKVLQAALPQALQTGPLVPREVKPKP